jgi:hypothetical protein
MLLFLTGFSILLLLLFRDTGAGDVGMAALFLKTDQKLGITS